MRPLAKTHERLAAPVRPLARTHGRTRVPVWPLVGRTDARTHVCARASICLDVRTRASSSSIIIFIIIVIIIIFIIIINIISRLMNSLFGVLPMELCAVLRRDTLLVIARPIVLAHIKRAVPWLRVHSSLGS